MSRPQATVEDVHASVLLVGVDAPGAAGVVSGLERDPLSYRVVGVDARPDAHGFALVDEAYTVPAGTDDGFLDRLHAVVARESIEVVFPLTTAELPPLADAKADLEDEGVSVMVADADALAVANDEGRLYEFLSEWQFAAAPTFRRVESRDGLVAAVERLSYPDRPVSVGRPVGTGACGFRVLDPSVDRFDHVLDEESVNAVTTLDDLLAVLDDAGRFPELVVVEYLPGPAYSVDVVATDDAVPAVVPRTSERTRVGVSVAGTVERNDELVAASRAIAAALGLEYNATLRYRYDDDGVPKLVAVEPRVAGGIGTSVGAGANLPAMGVHYALGLPIDEPDVAWGTTMRRFRQEALESSDDGAYTV